MIGALFRVVRSVVKGAEVGLKQRGKGFHWQLEDLKTTPYLYHAEHVKQLADKAIKSGDPQQIKLIREYILRHKAGNTPSYKAILRQIKDQLKPSKSDKQMLLEMKKEIDHLKHLLNSKSTSMMDYFDSFFT